MLWTTRPPARECHADAVKAPTIQRNTRRLFDELGDVAGVVALPMESIAKLYSSFNYI
jgi:hypothetical protein